MRDQFDIVGDVRGKGLMIGIEMVKDKVLTVYVMTTIWINTTYA